MIRHACTSDIPVLVALAEREHAGSQWHWLAFDRVVAERTAYDFITQVGRTVLFSGGGYLAGMVQPMGFTPRTAALEFAFYAEDGSGMALLSAFEQWAGNMGSAVVVVHDYTGADRLGSALVRRRGYRALGRALHKRLDS